MICPRCTKNGNVLHTCTPTKAWREIENQREELLTALKAARKGYQEAFDESSNPDDVEWAHGYLDDIDAVLRKFGIEQEGDAA